MFVALFLVSLILFGPTAINGDDFLFSLDFARNSLMRYSAGSTREVDVLTPVLQSKTELVPRVVRPSIIIGEKGAKGPEGSMKKLMVLKEVPIPNPIPMSTVVVKRQRKIYRPRASPSNKFLEALNEVERALTAAGADSRRSRHRSPQKLQEIAVLIKKAAKQRSFRYARALLGQALYLVKQQQPSSGGRSKRTSQNSASQFLDSLKRQLGDEQFNTFMAVQGDVTLMFAIDDSGSMSGEINKAKEIAIDVINHDRNAPVDYILSPFNDPESEVSRAVYNDETEQNQFVQAINNLRAHSGGDCPEFTYKGILRAIYEGPRWGSPMYIFTDADPKDATDENIDEVKALAEEYGITINFFTTGTCSSGVHTSFTAIATATNGQVFPLINDVELGQLNGLTGSVLGGSNSISIGSNLSNRKRRRGASDSSQHRIVIDDSIEELSVALTFDNSNQVQLLYPNGATVTSGKVSLSKTVVYQINNPQVGIWKLVVPASAGKYDFRVKSSSSTNIDFEHFFLFTPKRGRQKNIPITHPLSGEQAKVVLTVAGVNKVVPSSLSIELITEHGEHIADVSITSRGSGAHFVASFWPPRQPFKLKLKGNTRNGNAFERISRNVVKPTAGILRTLRATNEYTLRVAGREARVILQLYSVGSELFDITAKDSLGYFIGFTRNSVRARSRSLVLTTVRLRATRRSDVGKTNILFVRAKGRTSGVSLSHLVHLLVVE